MSRDPDRYDIGIFGTGAVGKSSIALCFVRDTFKDGYIPTNEDSLEKKITIDGTEVVVEIVGTCGQGVFEEIRYRLVNRIKSAIFVYDASNDNTFAELPDMVNEVTKRADKPIPYVFVANKMDLMSDGKPVKEEEARGLASKYNSQLFLTSAKLDQNIVPVFEYIIREMMKKKPEAKSEQKPESCCNIQ